MGDSQVGRDLFDNEEPCRASKCHFFFIGYDPAARVAKQLINSFVQVSLGLSTFELKSPATITSDPLNKALVHRVNFSSNTVDHSTIFNRMYHVVMLCM